jgi:flavorubredoxin
LAAHFHLGDVFTAVKDGETLSLGNMHATFLETRMLHWPDSMVTWLAEEGVLFSQDGFGQHLATSERWADQLDPALLRREAAKYYANILLPFSAFVVRLAERMQSLALPVRILAPDHGPLYRKDIGWIVDLWATWAAQKPEPKAVILYDTMWQSTATMARAVAEGLAAGGAATVRVLPARESHRSDVAAEILEAGALVLGSPTINGGIFPSLGDPLTYLEGLKRQHLIGAAFGSYGWSGEAVGKLEAWLRTAKVDVVAEGLKIQYVPDEAGLARAKAWGEKIGQALRERCAANRSV